MVVAKMRWAAEGDDDHRLPGGKRAASLGILAFEAATTMAKLLSLSRSLSEKEVAKLRSHAMRAAGVEYLSSTDQSFLLRLACAEAVAALDAAAAAVARLGARCGLDFAGPYTSLKAGAPDARLDQFVARGLKVKAKRMERLVAATAKLCAEMEALDELEAAEQKLARRGWGRLSGPIPSPAATAAAAGDALHLDIRAQRARVRRLKEESLWSQSYEKVVILMARAACAAFVRVCVIFGANVPGLPPPLPPTDAVHSRLCKLLLHPMSAAAAAVAAQPRSLSGPIQRRDVPLRIEMSSNSCPIIRSQWQQPGKTPPGADYWRKLLEPPPGTVGGAGLDLQYANVITTAERLLLETGAEGRHEEAREELYAMLPSKPRAAVRAKLRGWWRERGAGAGAAPPLDAGLAEGWRSAAGRILAWLAPMARDTARWHAERSMDRRRRFEVGGGGARAWALQTLRWADAEKAEAAVVEVLVALSCVCWYEERRRREASLRL
ncbi:uncharacterized protein LOC121054567 [Oryza brachyantha]|uniref:uncharacterized protein LOC121054567 n=1 Tax=Oryza brachyantha TaxID=4533 RepID=UPI001ADA47E8|nr:uncharacterized protein LOC121054567 [Oryza brachyantha]